MSMISLEITLTGTQIPKHSLRILVMHTCSDTQARAEFVVQMLPSCVTAEHPAIQAW